MRIYWKHKEPGEFDHEAAWGIIGLGILLVARFFPFSSVPLRMPCWFRELSGLPCPSCGSTRAFIALAHGHIVQGIQFNPAAAVLFFCLLGFVPYAAWVTLRRGSSRLRIDVSSARERFILVVALALLILINWTYLILASSR